MSVTPTFTLANLPWGRPLSVPITTLGALRNDSWRHCQLVSSWRPVSELSAATGASLRVRWRSCQARSEPRPLTDLATS